MIKQAAKPWLIASLAFMAMAGVMLRVAEHRSVTMMEGLAAEAEALAMDPTREGVSEPVPDEENAALLYDAAFQKLDLPEDVCDGIYWNGSLRTQWKLSDKADAPQEANPHGFPVISLPSQPFPEELRRRVDELLARHQESLSLLYRAANLSRVQWEVKAERGRPVRCWANDWSLNGLLIYDALARVLEGDGAGVVRAFQAIEALDRANEKLLFPLGDWRHWYFFTHQSAVEWILGCGLEKGVFSDESLEALDALFTMGPWSGAQSLQRGWRAMNHWRPAELRALEEYRAAQRGSSRNWMRRGALWFQERQDALAFLDVVLTGRMRQQWLVETELVGDAMLRQEEHDGLRAIDHRLNYWITLRNPWTLRPPTSLSYLESATNVLDHQLIAAGIMSTLRLVVALERYRRAEGSFPDKVEQLAPRYLPESQLERFRLGRNEYLPSEDGYAIQYIWWGGHNYQPWSYPMRVKT